MILPICIFGGVESCSNYNEAKEHLTPYSVSVSGYYRSDGTYIKPYKRRPKGGVAHDKPYINKMSRMRLYFLVCLFVGGWSIWFFSTISINRVEEENAKRKKT